MNYAEAVAKEAPEAAAGAAGAPAEQAAPAISASAAKGIEGACSRLIHSNGAKAMLQNECENECQ